MNTIEIANQLSEIATLKEEVASLDFKETSTLRRVTEILLFAVGPVEIDGITVSVQRDYECINLYAERTIKRGCVQWREKTSLFGIPQNGYDLMRRLVPHILSGGYLERKLSSLKSQVAEHKASLENIQSIHDRLNK